MIDWPLCDRCSAPEQHGNCMHSSAEARVAAMRSVGAAAFGVHACAARLGRDDARVVMRQVGVAAVPVQGEAHGSAAITLAPAA